MEKQFSELLQRKENPFGVLEFLPWNHPWNNHKYPDQASLKKITALIKRAGVTMVRMDFLWQDIEPRRDDFDFIKYDHIIELLSKNGIEVLGLLSYSTDWSGASWNAPPYKEEDFLDYVRAVVARYKGKVRYWEIWNEPDSRIYWNDQDGLKGYCVLLKNAYIAAKEADPGCKVLNGGFAQGISSVSRLYENGAKDYFDIMNVHIFYSPLDARAIKSAEGFLDFVHKIMKRNNDAGKKIWVTEIGSPGVKSSKVTKNWWLGDNPDEDVQARWLKEVYTKLLKHAAVEKIFWAFFRDTKEHWKDGTDYFGLVRWDYSLKPAYFTYQKLSKGWKKK